MNIISLQFWKSSSLCLRTACDKLSIGAEKITFAQRIDSSNKGNNDVEWTNNFLTPKLSRSEQLIEQTMAKNIEYNIHDVDIIDRFMTNLLLLVIERI